jgi:hypothetical protein
VDPNTDSIEDGFGEGNSGTGESDARTASMDDATVSREKDETLAAVSRSSSSSREVFSTSFWCSRVYDMQVVMIGRRWWRL